MIDIPDRDAARAGLGVASPQRAAALGRPGVRRASGRHRRVGRCPERCRPATSRDSRARRPQPSPAASVTDAIVVAADTTVDVDGQILEKPIDDADARRMLALLSGRTHLVHTGVTVLRSGGVGSGRTGTVVVTTAVRVRGSSRRRSIDWYVATGEPFGKAGALRDPGRRRCARAATRRQRHQRDRSPARRDPRPRSETSRNPVAERPDSAKFRAIGVRAVSTLGCRLLTEG